MGLTASMAEAIQIYTITPYGKLSLANTNIPTARPFTFLWRNITESRTSTTLTHLDTRQNYLIHIELGKRDSFSREETR